MHKGGKRTWIDYWYSTQSLNGVKKCGRDFCLAESESFSPLGEETLFGLAFAPHVVWDGMVGGTIPYLLAMNHSF